MVWKMLLILTIAFTNYLPVKFLLRLLIVVLYFNDLFKKSVTSFVNFDGYS